MLFDFEPSGINDTYLRLTRNGLSCIVAPAGAWNGLVRVNYIVAGAPGSSEPYMIFRSLDVGWDDGRFCWKGRAAPVMTSSAMVDILLDRGMVTEAEAERLLFGINTPAAGATSDESLMIRALLAGCSFTPVYDQQPLSSEPPTVAGFAMRTLSDPGAFMLEARNGIPVLDSEARDALRRLVGVAM
ncbi:hypothetical protein GBZ48_32805 [Azospirillum melinis]|uniref:Uncharacterized protein n=1 Tax=Azospirillum melinis TaxID=328839 RepID=A0ABX2KK50_9PROT|nr:hypothetical protein [Azospirillum melinis]MBP2308209.1 hypothetical protein [Azospirillum melinis]NUB03993.1 hypothetical protein [Azospirillum melinis]